MASPALISLSAVVTDTIFQPLAPSLAFPSAAAWSRGYLPAQTAQQNRLSGAGEP